MRSTSDLLVKSGAHHGGDQCLLPRREASAGLRLLQHQLMPYDRPCDRPWARYRKSRWVMHAHMRGTETRLRIFLCCSMRRTKWDVPAKCPVEELPCGFHLEVGTPGDLSTMARVQNKPFDARAVCVDVAYGAHQT